VILYPENAEQVGNSFKHSVIGAFFRHSPRCRAVAAGSVLVIRHFPFAHCNPAQNGMGNGSKNDARPSRICGEDIFLADHFPLDLQ
jgi:hypothetical protein